MDSSGDTEMACLLSGGELALFLMWTLLVIQTVSCFVSVGELALFSRHSSGDADMAWLVSGGDLAPFLMYTLSGDTVACLVSGCELALL